jgi:hypothetical protein
VNALTRCEEASPSLKQYLGSLTVQNLAVSQLESVLEQYESTGARLEAKKTEIKRELQRMDMEIKAERMQLAVPLEHNKLRNKVIGVFYGGNVEIVLIYGVSCI